MSPNSFHSFNSYTGLLETARAAAKRAKREHEYTLADLQEVDRLLRELAELEGWPEEELADLLDQRRRMAPVNVLPALQVLRAAHAAALAPRPNQPKKRSKIRLCFLVPLALIYNEEAA